MGSPTQQRWVCGFCGLPASKYRFGPDLAHAPYWVVLGQHVWAKHGVELEVLEASRQQGSTWVLPDGRVWMRDADEEFL